MTGVGHDMVTLPAVRTAIHQTHVAYLDPEIIELILDAIRNYDQFNEDIDPYCEHDMGRLTVFDEDYYWKIDYYDRNLEYHSPDPADPSVTIRVLTIMRTEEY